MTTTTKTVEQLKAELAAAQEALAVQEKEALRKIREAEQAEARAKAFAAQEEVNVKMDAAFAPVVEKFGPTAVKKNRFELVLPYGVSISIGREEKKVSSYRSAYTYTGRYLVTVGYEYGFGAEACRSRYPSKQDGTFSMDKIAIKVADLMEAKTLKQSAAEAKLSQKLEAERLANELNNKHATRLCSPSYTHSSSKGGGRHEYVEYIAAAGHVYIGATQYNPAQVEVYVRMMAEIKALATKA